MTKLKNNITYTIENIEKAVKIVRGIMPYCSVIGFKGDLGAGKTTLIKALLRDMGINDVITSPTFTYMAHYKNDQENEFYHFDLYRIQNVEEFLAYGFDEYLYQEKSWAFIEWPEVIHSLLKKNCCIVKIDYINESTRKLSYTFSCDNVLI